MIRYRSRACAAILAGAVLAASAAAEEVTLDHDGVRLNGELALAEGKSIADGLILMTHGTLAHGRMEIMRGLQEVFEEHGFNTLAITLSLGQSDRRDMYDCATPHRHRHTDAMGEIGAWLAWAKGQGAEEVVLLGHSRGGNQTAWFAAEENNPAVQAVVLVAPATWDAEREQQQYRQRYGADLSERLAEATRLVEEGEGDTLLEGVGFLYCEDAQVTAAAFVDYYRDDPRKDTPQLLARIEPPVLVIAGSEDAVVEGLPEKVEPLADGDVIELVVIDGAEHMFRDLHQYDVVEAVQSFLEARR